jgi:hypothetical protein
MRSATAAVLLAAAASVSTPAQCPYYSSGSISAGLSRAGGGEDVRLVYVDCVNTIGIIYAKFGNTSNSTNLNGLPLTIAVYDDPTNDHDPHDAVLIAMASIPGGVTGGNTGQWQRYDLKTLFNAPIPATGGMFVAVGVRYQAATSPGPGSIEFNNVAPGTQWLATDSGNLGINYSSIGTATLVDIQTGPGFPAGTWVIRVESGAEYRSFGSGCPGSNGTPHVAGAPVLPSLGSAAIFNITNLPNPSVANFGLLGFDLQTPAVDLGTATGHAANGCLVVVNPLATPLLSTTAGTSSMAVAVPNSPSFVGLSLLAQAVAFDPTANAAGLTASNGLRAVVGW